MALAINIVIGTIVLGSIYAMIAQGIVFIFRSTGVINFAHGEMLALGAWLALVLTIPAGVPPVLAAIFSSLMVGLVLALCYQLIVRRVEHNGLFVAVIATMGIAFMFDGLMLMVFGQTARSLNLLPRGSITILPGSGISVANVVVVMVTALIYVAVVVADQRLTLGIQMRAAAADRVLASQCGIRVRLVFFTAWAIAGVLAAAAGILYSATTIVSADLTAIGLIGLPAALVGGFDSLKGGLPGGLLVALVVVVTSTVIGSSSAFAATFILLLAFLMFRPQGLFGAPIVDRV